MKYTLLLFSIFVLSFCKAQNLEKNKKQNAINYSVDSELTHTYCGQNNGIARIFTDAISPTFEWLNNELSIDSIAYSLAGGNHSVKITDINKNQTIYNFYINDYQTCTPLNTPNFNYEALAEGFLKVQTYQNASLIFEWNMGDGNIYSNKPVNFYHKYSTSGTYNVCLTISRNGQSYCQSIAIPDWSSTVSGVNTVISSNNSSINNLIVKKACDCGDKSYLFASSQSSRTVKIYHFDPITDTATLLPIDELYNGSYPNINTECFNNNLYFFGRVDTNGFELCQSDGTFGGTYMTHNYVTLASKGVNPNNFRVYNNMLYFDGMEQGDGYVVQRTLMLVGNSVQQVSGSYIAGFENNRIFNNKMIHNSGGLKTFDGTNTQLLTPQDALAYIYDELNGVVIFRKFQGYYNPNDDDIWRSDGTVAGTYILKDIRPGVFSTTQNISFVKHNNYMYFVANDGNVGHELWITDGTAIGTRLVKDIHESDVSFNISDFVVFNGKVYFLAKSTGISYSSGELWETDGTTNGTHKVVSTTGKQITRSSDSEDLYTDGSFLFFNVNEYSNDLFSAINTSNEYIQISQCYDEDYTHYGVPQ